MAGDALQQRKGIADTVARSGGELAWVEQRIDRDDLLQQASHDTEAMPQDQSKFRNLLSLLAELHKRTLATSRFHEVCYPLQDLAVVFGDLLVAALLSHGGERRGSRLIAIVLPRGVVLVDGYASVVLLARLALLVVTQSWLISMRPIFL